MIPWEKFKTPQDAYEWAKSVTATYLLGSCPKTGDTLLLAVVPMPDRPLLCWVNEARACRLGIIALGYDLRVRR